MGLLDTVLSALSGSQTGSPGSGGQLASVLEGILTQNGGLAGLMEKFNHGGLGGIFSSWVGVGENQGISSGQITHLLGSDQVAQLAQKLGVDPGQAAAFMAEHLPRIVDQLTPGGNLDSSANHAQGIAGLLPTLLASLTGKSGGGAA
jgi:uncharacterized protein YidB (DUF937 family)